MERYPRPVSAPPTPIPRPSTSPSLTASAKIPSEGGIRSRESGHRSFRSKSLRARGGAARGGGIGRRNFTPIWKNRKALAGPRPLPQLDRTFRAPHISSEAHRGAMEAREERGLGVPVCECVCVRTRVCLFKIRGVIPQRWSRRWGIASVDRGFVS